MADFIDKYGILFNDFNSKSNYIVCVWPQDKSPIVETIKEFEENEINEALKYAMSLKLDLSFFGLGAKVNFCCHKKLFDKII